LVIASDRVVMLSALSDRFGGAMNYRPLSKRDVADPDLDTLHEAVEPWMVEPLITWLQPLFWLSGTFESSSNEPFIEGFEMAHCERRPFDRRGSHTAAVDVQGRISQGGAFGLDLANYALHRYPDSSSAHSLQQLLRKSRSAWEVTALESDDGLTRFTLTRRDLAAAKLAISEIRPHHERAGAFLGDAWKAVATRDRQPNEGYDKAVKAIEAVAQPVVSPNNARATLGTIVRDMRAKPSKWTFALGDLDLIIDLADRVWTEHLRHGTDQRRTDHTLEEADAALHLAIPLVRYFSGGLIAVAVS
jgi:hypothetical protein